MKKNLVYIVIAVVLAAVVGYLVWSDGNKNRAADDQNFATANVDDVTRIFLAAKDGRTIKLDKEDDHWIVNDTFKAMPAKVDLLLSTLKSFVIYSPVPEAAWENAIKELAVYSVKVELYDDNDDAPFKVFFVGRPNQGQTANYMLMQIDGKSAKQPYLINIPGFIGDLQTRFLLNTHDWRDLNIFNYKLNEIKEVSILYHDIPEASFTLSATTGDDFKLTQQLTGKVATQEQLFKAGVNKFLDSFANLNAEAVENEFAYKDSVINGPKFATITVTNTDGEKNQMIMYRMPTNRRSKMMFDAQNNPVPYDVDRYYAVFNNGADFGVVQHYVFGKILRGYEDFLIKAKEDKPAL